MRKIHDAPIAATDRVIDVLDRDEALVEIFVRNAPQFERLRSRTVRGVMARMVTVEQAARMGRVAVDQFLRDLNGALTGSASDATTPDAATSAAPPANAEQPPLT